MVEPTTTPGGDFIFDVPDNWKVIKHSDASYNYKKTLGKGGCGVVMVYEDPMTSHKMAVKFEVLTAAKGGYRMSPLNNEDIVLKQLWKRNSSLNHIPLYHGQYMLPENHIKMEYID